MIISEPTLGKKDGFALRLMKLTLIMQTAFLLLTRLFSEINTEKKNSSG